MKIGKLAVRMTAVCTAVISAAVLTAGSASADYNQCEPGWFCMWENNAYTGRFFALRNMDAPNFSKSFNDKMTSFWNRSDQTYHVFQHSNYEGNCLATVSPGESTSAVAPWANDEATSARRRVPDDIHMFCQG